MKGQWSILIGLFVASGAMATPDPTAPWPSDALRRAIVSPKATTEAMVLPQLQSLMCQEAHCKGVVNDRLVSVGDTILGFRVVRIDASLMVIRKGRQQWQLRVRNPTARIKIG